MCEGGRVMKMKAGRRSAWLGCAAFLLVLAGEGSRAADAGNEMWNWLNVDMITTERWRFHLYMDQRLAQHRGSYIQLASPRLKFRAHPNLEFGAGFSLLHIERGDTNDFFAQPRPELEINPRWQWGDHWRVHFRNRWEIRWNDWEGKPRHRSRHRVQVSYDLSGAGFFKGFYSNNEWFVEYDRDAWTENRWTPVGLSFRLSEATTLHLFYMQRSFHTSGVWTHDHIGGTFLSVKL